MKNQRLIQKPHLKVNDPNSEKQLKHCSLQVRNLVSSAKSCILHTPNFGYSASFQKQIQEGKKKLERKRLEIDSLNTLLLRKQQQERVVNQEYQEEKERTEKKLEDLARRAEEFNEQQRKMNEQLEEQKTNIVIKQDNKREKEEDSRRKDEMENKKRKQTLKEYKEKISVLEEEYEKLKQQKKQLQQYEDFLNQVMTQQKDEREQNANMEEQDKNVSSIIDRFFQMKKESTTFLEESKKMEQKQDEIRKKIKDIQGVLQMDHLQNTSEINQLKQQIDKVNQENAELMLKVDAKFSDQRGKHLDYGQIYFGINNLYYEYIYKPQQIKKKGMVTNDENREEQEPKDPTQNILDKLGAIEKYLNNQRDIKSAFEQAKIKQAKEQQNL